jgi:hypothetical protein
LAYFLSEFVDVANPGLDQQSALAYLVGTPIAGNMHKGKQVYGINAMVVPSQEHSEGTPWDSGSTAQLQRAIFEHESSEVVGILIRITDKRPLNQWSAHWAHTMLQLQRKFPYAMCWVYRDALACGVAEPIPLMEHFCARLSPAGMAVVERCEVEDGHECCYTHSEDCLDGLLEEVHPMVWYVLGCNMFVGFFGFLWASSSVIMFIVARVRV